MYSDFMEFTDYAQRVDVGVTKVYTPYADIAGPLFFFPPHCYSKSDLEYESPIIAIVRNGNSIEDDVAE